jgi:hypothetical protein
MRTNRFAGTAAAAAGQQQQQQLFATPLLPFSCFRPSSPSFQHDVPSAPAPPSAFAGRPSRLDVGGVGPFLPQQRCFCCGSRGGGCGCGKGGCDGYFPQFPSDAGCRCRRQSLRRQQQRQRRRARAAAAVQGAPAAAADAPPPSKGTRYGDHGRPVDGQPVGELRPLPVRHRLPIGLLQSRRIRTDHDGVDERDGQLQPAAVRVEGGRVPELLLRRCVGGGRRTTSRLPP